MGDPRVARCLQGAGVFVQGGTVSIVNSQIYSNTAPQVRVPATPANFHHPDGKTADVLARLTLAQLRTTLRSTLLQFVRATDTLQIFPSPR